ncbi:hypothetical protein ASZ78_011877, partial [Callipepla squamata]
PLVVTVDLSSWRARLEQAEAAPEEEEEEEQEEEEEEEEEGGAEEEEEYGAGGPPPQWERYRHGVLTLGCVAWAEKRGYRTARAARHDVYRAANAILRMAANGTLRLCFRPPGYTAHCGEEPAPPASPIPSCVSP